MALPVTITGISTAVAPVGPFKVAVPVISTGPFPGGTNLQIGGTTATIRRAQSFLIGGSNLDVSQILWPIFNNGATDNWYCDIYAEASGIPTGAVLATSAARNAAAFISSGNGQLEAFQFSPAVTLTAATKYCAVLRRAGDTPNAANLIIAAVSTTDIYASGGYSVFDGTSWGGVSANDITIGVGASDAFYFFGRDATTATTLQAYKSVLVGTVYSIATNIIGSTSFGNNTDTGNRLSQTFTTGASTQAITSVAFALSKNGTPTDNLVVDLQLFDTGTNKPTGSVLGTTAAIAGSTLTTSNVRYTFTFATPVAVSPSTRYAAIIRRVGAGSSTNYYFVARDNGFLNFDSAQVSNTYTVSLGTFDSFSFTDYDLSVSGISASTPDVSWGSIATKTGFTTAILKLDAYQVGNVIHLLVQDGTASTSLATKYVSFDTLNNTFLATTETVSAAVAVTGQIAGANASASLVVRSNGEVVAFYSGVQTKISGTFRAHVFYRRRTGVNTWTTETAVNAATAFDNNYPVAVLGAADRVHFVWGVAPSSTGNRTLSAANALNTAASSASMAAPGDGVSYDRSGTTKVVITSNATGQTVQRFDSSDNPTASYSTPTAANATLPHRIGTFPNTDDVTIVYRNSADSDIYSIKSSDDGATFGTAVSFFVGTVASADANVSRSSSGSVYARGSNNVVGYLVNDGGTLKYNENVVSTSSTNYTDTITSSALPIAGSDITDVYVGSVAYSDTITASSVPIGGATVAPIYSANYADTITPSTVPIGGATLATDVFASQDTITASTVPVGGAALADTFARSDTLTASSVPVAGAALADVLAFADTLGTGALPIAGQTISPVYTANYADTLTASAVPIGGASIVPVFSAGAINYTDTITASALPLVGATVAPVYTANYSDTVVASAVPIGGSTIAPVYTARYSDTLTASDVPLVGQAITPVFSAGAINYTDTISPSGVPIGGQAVTPLYTANYSDTLTASSLPIGGVTLADLLARSDTLAGGTVPIGGSTLADTFARSDTLAASSVPVVGSTIVPVYTARYADTLTASALPITGQAITPNFSAGAVNYTEVIAPSAVPIGGATIAPSAKLSDTLTAGALPLVGQALVPVFSAGAINYTDTITASAVPLVGQSITPVFTVAEIAGKTWVKVGGVWQETETYVKVAGAWVQPIASFVKDGGVWKAI
jgi:hypothetical protein